MRWSDLPLHPTPPMLRRFGGVGCLILGGIAGWQLYQARWIAACVLLGLALILGASAWLRPAALRPVFVALIVLAFPVNWLMSHLILAVIFCCVFTPVALCFRLIGRDVLVRRRRGSGDTYWSDKPKADGVRSYFRQS